MCIDDTAVEALNGLSRSVLAHLVALFSQSFEDIATHVGQNKENIPLRISTIVPLVHLTIMFNIVKQIIIIL